MSALSEQEEFEFRLRAEREAQALPVGAGDTPLVNRIPGLENTLDSQRNKESDDDVLIKAKIGPDLKKSQVQELMRQLGLTARYGIEGIGGVADMVASPARVAMNLAGANVRGDTGKSIANLIGLPTPSGKMERVVGDVARTMAASGGMMGAAKTAAPMLSGASRSIAESLAANPATQTISAAGAGLGSGIARESGSGAGGQMVSGLLGGLVAPVATSAIAGISRGVSNIGSLLGATQGNQASINKLAGDAATKIAGDSAGKLIPALRNATEFVPGVKPTVAEAIAEQTVGKPYVFGGKTARMQKTLSGASGLEDALPTTQRAQKVAIEAFTEGVEKSLAPVRNSLLRRANKVGVDTAPILQKIDDVITTPGTREAEMVKSVIPKISAKISDMKQSAPGIVDSRDIYALRKNLYKTIKEFSKESGTWDKKLGAKLERDIQLQIDGAIDRSLGNNMWSKGYMNTYSQKMKSVRDHQARMDEAKEVTKAVKGTNLNDVVRGEAPQFPTLLSRPMMAVNFALKTVLGDANTPVAKELARRMADPVEYAKLIALPPTHPTKKLLERVQEIAATTLAAQQSAAQEEQQ